MRYSLALAALLVAISAPAAAQIRTVDLASAARAFQEYYPPDAIRREASVATISELWFDEKGSIFRCKVHTYAGDEKLKSEICSIFASAARGRVKPAYDATGKASVARVVTVLKMTIPYSSVGNQLKTLEPSPDIELTVKSLPAGASTVDVTASLAVDQTGVIKDCSVADERSDELAQATCRAIIGSEFFLGTGPDNAPRDYVTTALVRLTAK